MKWKACIYTVLLMLMMVCPAAADSRVVQAEIDIQFGNEVYTNQFEVTWETELMETIVTSSSVPLADSFYIINQDGVRLLTSYSLSSAVKTTMNREKPVQAFRKYNVGGTIWYYITVKNSSGTFSGYVRSNVLTKVTKEQYETTYGGIRFDGNANNTGNSGVYEILGMIRITGNNVAIRESNDSDSAKVDTANKGDVFFYTKKSGNWYQLQSGYWVKNTYATELSESEIDDYMGNGSYTGSSYRNGDEDPMVLWIQLALDKLGYYDGEHTGYYGNKTEDAVRTFQRNHGLSADGIAGYKTISKISEEYSKKVSSGTYNSKIYNINWFSNKSTIIRGIGTYKLTDIATGHTMKIKIQSAGNHADVEPLTAEDTEVLCILYGVVNASQLETMNKWQRRAVVMTNGNGEQFVGSIYVIPHGQDTVSGNNFDGQFCLYFKGSTIHAGDGGSVPESSNHQAKIANGAAALKAAGYTIVETYP